MCLLHRSGAGRLVARTGDPTQTFRIIYFQSMQGIHSVRLILRETVLENAWITFEDGMIAGFGQGTPPGGGKYVDGEGLFLAPGFIDTHVHGGNGADFLDGTAEAFLRVADYHLAHGTTALCPTLATATYDHIKAVVETWESAKGRAKGRLLPLHLEGPHLARTKAGAQNPELITPPTSENIEWVVENAAAIAQMTVAPEIPNALELIEKGSEAGIVMSAGHTEAREQEMKAGLERGIAKITHLFNAMSYAAKKGVFREPGLAEYALVEDRVVCELIADNFHVAPTLMKLAYRAKGAGRLTLISDALAGTGLPVGTTFLLGKLQCKVAEGVCMLADGSALAGSATRSIDQVRILTQVVGAPLAEAVRMATETPARLLGLEDRYGSIGEGKAADLVQFDAKFGVRRVWVGGEVAHSYV